MTHIRLCTQRLANIKRTRAVWPTLSHTLVSAISTTISTLSRISATAGGSFDNDEMTAPVVSCSASAAFIRRVCKVLCCDDKLPQGTTNKSSTVCRRIVAYSLRETIRDKKKTHDDTDKYKRIGQRSEAMSAATITRRQESNKVKSMKSMKSARIVIIGAGSAGIAAATRLLQSGFENVLLLEAESRYGGRVHTIPFADNVVDLGAQWCHGEKSNVIFDAVRDLDMLQPTGDIYDDYICVRSNKEVLSETVANTLKSVAFNLIAARQEGLKCFEGSLGTYLTEAFWRDLQQSPEIEKTVAHEFFENYKKFESSVEASDHLFEVSGKGHLEYWICEGDLLLNWKDKGFRSFLRLLMKTNKGKDAADADDMGLLNKRIQFNARVQNIEWQTRSGDVRIRLWNGELIDADHVVCTISLGVLKENHKEMFTPALPLAKCRAIDGLKLGTVDKFFLEFNEPFAPLDWSGFWFLWRNEELAELRNSDYFWLESVFGFYRVSCQPRILQGWIIGPHARHMETLPEAEVLKALLWLFKKFFTFEVPPPLRFLRTRWYTNPNFRGSYTFRTLYTDELRTGGWDLAAPLTAGTDGKPLLQFAGEATHTHFYSTVHGAVESGWREAQRLITYYLGHTSQL